MPAIFDTHCHYNLEPLLSEWQRYWAEAQQHGLVGSMQIGTDLASCHAAVSLAEQAPAFWAAVGIHPNEYDSLENDEELEMVLDRHLSELSGMLTSTKVKAIGETGLDYFRLDNNPAIAQQQKKSQRDAFTMHIDLANHHQLPLVIHGRDTGEQAYADILELLQRRYAHQRPFILHCVSGPNQYVLDALELGAYIGVAGNVTYKNAEHIRELVRLVPADRLLSETDAPYLPPQQFRGKTCEPWMIAQTVEFLERELGADPQQLLANAYQVFAIAA